MRALKKCRNVEQHEELCLTAALVKKESTVNLLDTQALYAFRPVTFAPTRRRFAFLEDEHFMTSLGGQVRAILAKMKGAQVLSGLINPIEFGGKIETGLGVPRDGTVAAPDPNLTHHDWFVSALNVSDRIIRGGLEEFHVLTDQALVLTQRVSITVHG